MINQSLDFYDDLDGHTLKEKVSDFRRLPDFIKTAEQLSPEIRNQLPDDVFALVMLDGGQKMRKYACTDKGNTALSVIYFLENRDHLPEEAQKVAAANLVRACKWHALEPPDQLVKIAAGIRFNQLMSHTDPSTLRKAREIMKRSKPGDVQSIDLAVKRHIDPLFKGGPQRGVAPKKKALEALSEAESMVHSTHAGLPKTAGIQKTALIGAAMNVMGAVDAARQGKENLAKLKAKHGESGAPQSQEPMKVSELTGSDVMPYSLGDPEKTKKAEMRFAAGIMYDPSDPRVQALQQQYGDEWVEALKDNYGVKTASVGQLLPAARAEIEKVAYLMPHVDVTGKRAPALVEHKQAGQFFCLIKEGGARYPIDTAQEVEKAAEYFINYGQRFSPFERHRYCANLTKRAEDLGMHVPDTVRKYGSAGYAPDVQVAIARRRQYFHEGATEHGLLTEMMQKCAAIVPETFAVMLEQFDRATGLADRWGNGIDDPYFSVFGFVKEANWGFTYANDHITEDQLHKLARDTIRRDELKRRFGCEMVEGFEKDPIQIFDSLPLEHKRIIMRMASGVEE